MIEGKKQKRYRHSKFYFKNGKPDYTLLKEKLKVVKLFNSLSNQPFFINDLYKGDYAYISEIPKHFTGYDLSEIESCGADAYALVLTERDLLFLRKTEPILYRFIDTIDKEKRKGYVVTIGHYLINKDGTIIPIVIYKTPLLFDDDENVWMLLARIAIANKNLQEKNFLYVDIADSNERYAYDEKTGTFNIIERPVITPMEKNILQLSNRGFLEKETAEHLNISINTVKTHKKNVLRKLGVENMSEAYLMATVHKLI